MTTKVVKLKRKLDGTIVQGCDIYIGRRMTMGGWNLPESKWKNPFTVKECGSNEKAVAKYEEYILKKPELLKDIESLRGKVLGCWCKVNSSVPCHGDVLVNLLKQRKEEEKNQGTKKEIGEKKQEEKKREGKELEEKIPETKMKQEEKNNKTNDSLRKRKRIEGSEQKLESYFKKQRDDNIID